MQDVKTKKCTVTETKPTSTETTVVSGDTVYKTKAEAETGMKTVKVCTSNDIDACRSPCRSSGGGFYCDGSVETSSGGPYPQYRTVLRVGYWNLPVAGPMHMNKMTVGGSTRHP